MPIGVTEDHEELHRVARRWVDSQCPPALPRAALEAETEVPAPFWGSLAELGWLGLHVDEDHGGTGAGVGELAVVLEELGRAMAPGAFLPTVLATTLIDQGGNEATAKALLPALVAGELAGAVAFQSELTGVQEDRGLVVSGAAAAVPSAHLAGVLVAPVDVEGAETWCVLEGADFATEEQPSLDPTRRVATVTVDGAIVSPERRLEALGSERARDVSAVLLASEAIGVAQWCVDAAATYAKERRQFGRPIGQFQGVKHRCADMLARLELARAATWDAARALDDEAASPEQRSLTAAAAAALAFDAAVDNAKDCIQIHGGIGFTWEHDAHLYLRRATALRQLVGSTDRWRTRVARLVRDGARRGLDVDLPPEAEQHRAEVRAFLSELDGLDAAAARVRMADAGYLTPSWPEPWGRDADAVEQLVIQEEFRRAKVRRPTISIAAWALPTLIVYGSVEQQERWIMPTLRGEVEWCQLFSEPGAGSDLAGLATKAERDGDGWRLNGQKVWTSLAQRADWGICLARTDPDAPKHEGISCFMVDMRSEGIDIRPLRELTGNAMFNEVFFDGCFVPADCLVGEENDGWRVARTTLANERVFMGSGGTVGRGVRGIVKLLDERDLADDDLVLERVGRLAAESHALACLGFRLTLSALRGADPGASEAAVRKLLSVQHDQDVQEVGLALLGPDGTVAAGVPGDWSRQFLFNRQLTIAGGTSEVQRNIIGERVLGLPKDP